MFSKRFYKIRVSSSPPYVFSVIKLITISLFFMFGTKHPSEYLINKVIWQNKSWTCVIQYLGHPENIERFIFTSYTYWIVKIKTLTYQPPLLFVEIYHTVVASMVLDINPHVLLTSHWRTRLVAMKCHTNWRRTLTHRVRGWANSVTEREKAVIVQNCVKSISKNKCDAKSEWERCLTCHSQPATNWCWEALHLSYVLTRCDVAIHFKSRYSW